jgi:hypothetical protein
MQSLEALTSSGLRNILPRGVQLPQRLGIARSSNPSGTMTDFCFFSHAGFGGGEVGVADFLQEVDRGDLGGDGFEPVVGIHKCVRIRI